MSEPRSLRAANWLLRELGPAEGDEALLGDLTEEYARRRSAAWYWKQVFSAILVGAGSDLRKHPIVMILALLLGWMVLAAPVALTIGVWIAHFELWHEPPFDRTWFGPLMNSSLWAGPVLSGWTVGRVFAEFRMAAVLTVFASFLLAATVTATQLLLRVPPRAAEPTLATALTVFIVLLTGCIALSGMVGRRGKGLIGSAIADRTLQGLDHLIDILRPMRRL